MTKKLNKPQTGVKPKKSVFIIQLLKKKKPLKLPEKNNVLLRGEEQIYQKGQKKRHDIFHSAERKKK